MSVLSFRLSVSSPAFQIGCKIKITSHAAWHVARILIAFLLVIAFLVGVPNAAL